MEKKKAMQKGQVSLFLSITVLAVITAALLLVICSRQRHRTERLVSEYLQGYPELFSTSDIRILSEELESQIDEKISMAGFREEDESQELLAAVCQKLEQATYSIPEEKIREISEGIVKEILGKTAKAASGQPTETITENIGAITVRVPETDIGIQELTSADIRRIAGELDWTEEEIKSLINSSLSITDSSLKRIADALNISVNDLARTIAENRQYTDALYITLADALDTDASELKGMLDGHTNTSAEDIRYLAKKLKVTEGRLNAEITKSKALSDSEIAAVADKLQISYEELQELIIRNMGLTENGMLQIINQTTAELDNLRRTTNTNISGLGEKMENGIGQLEAADNILMQSIYDAEGNANAELKKTEKTLQDMIGSNSTDIADTSRALQEAESALKEGIAGIRKDMESQGSRTEQGITEINQQITAIQGGIATYTWGTDASGNTTLTVTIPGGR